MVHTAKVLALTAMALYREPAKLAEAKCAFDEQVADAPYRCPIPADASPPIEVGTAAMKSRGSLRGAFPSQYAGVQL
jgi:aminobenzoyl-glutamate utilization protein B